MMTFRVNFIPDPLPQNSVLFVLWILTMQDPAACPTAVFCGWTKLGAAHTHYNRWTNNWDEKKRCMHLTYLCGSHLFLRAFASRRDDGCIALHRSTRTFLLRRGRDGTSRATQRQSGVWPDLTRCATARSFLNHSWALWWCPFAHVWILGGVPALRFVRSR